MKDDTNLGLGYFRSMNTINALLPEIQMPDLSPLADTQTPSIPNIAKSKWNAWCKEIDKYPCSPILLSANKHRMDNHSSICDWHTEFGMEKSLSPFDCLCQIFRDFDNEALFLAYSRTLITVTSSDGGPTGQREMKRRWQNTLSIVQH